MDQPKRLQLNGFDTANVKNVISLAKVITVTTIH